MNTSKLSPFSILKVVDILGGIISFGLGVLWLVYPFEDPCIRNGVLCTIAVSGSAFWAFYLFLWFSSPVLRDWILVKGNLIWKILCGVYLTPFMLAFYLGYFTSIRPGDLLDRSSSEASVEESCPSDTPADVLDGKKNEALFLTVYYNFIDPGTQLESSSPRGRLFAACIAFLGIILLNGLFVTTLINWFDRRRDAWHRGEIRYKRPSIFLHKHLYVVIGGNEMATGIVRMIFELDREAFVLIQTSGDVERFRKRLFSFLTPNEALAVAVYYGNRTSDDDIASLCLHQAKEVYILGEDIEQDEKGSYHDTLNMECLELVAAYIKRMREDMSVWRRLKKCFVPKKPVNLPCYVMFEFQSTFSIFQFSEISNEIKDYLSFRPFNSYEMWAQQVFVSYGLNRPAPNDSKGYLPLEGWDGIGEDSDSFVHLVVLGMSRMGVSLAVQAAHLAHYPNFVRKGKKTRITFIDSHMDEEIDFFKGRFDALFNLSRHRYVKADFEDTRLYRYACASGKQEGNRIAQRRLYDSEEGWSLPLVDGADAGGYDCHYLGDEIMDIEWEFVHGSVEGLEVQQYLIDAASNPDAKLTVAVCLPESNKAIASAIYLPKKVFENALQVLVYQRTNDSLIADISKHKFATPFIDKLKSFGMVSETFSRSIMNQCAKMGELFGQRYGVIAKDVSGSFKRLCEEALCTAGIDRTSLDLSAWMESKEKDVAFMGRVEAKQAELMELMEGMTRETGQVSGKTAVSSWWSNIYSSSTIWTKLRCIGYQGGELDKHQIYLLSEVEHNRWNMEQLMMSYRPLTPEEQFIVIRHNVECERIRTSWSAPEVCKANRSRLDELTAKAIEARKELEGLRFGAFRTDSRLVLERKVAAAEAAVHAFKKEWLEGLCPAERQDLEFQFSVKELEEELSQKRAGLAGFSRFRGNAARLRLEQDVVRLEDAVKEVKLERMQALEIYRDFNRLLKNRMAHFNICSCSRLRDIDCTYKYDVGFSAYLPAVYDFLRKSFPEIYGDEMRL